MKKYVGSCGDDSIGIGTIIIGTDYRTSSGDYPYEVYYPQTDNWIECYDVVTVDIADENDILYVA